MSFSNFLMRKRRACCCSWGWILFLKAYRGSLGILVFSLWENSPSSWLFHRGINATISAQAFNSKWQEKYPRSRPDRLGIMDRSPLDHDHDQERSCLRLKRSQGQISLGLRPRYRRMETASRTLQNCSHDHFNCLRSSG